MNLIPPLPPWYEFFCETHTHRQILPPRTLNPMALFPKCSSLMSRIPSLKKSYWKCHIIMMMMMMMMINYSLILVTGQTGLIESSHTPHTLVTWESNSGML